MLKKILLESLALALMAVAAYSGDLTLDNFEGASTEAWQWSVGDASVSIDSDAKEGNSALRIVFGAKQGKPGIAQFLEIGKLVKGMDGFKSLSLWIKGDASDHNVRIYLRQGENEEFWAKSPFSLLDASWRKVEIKKEDFERCPWCKEGDGKLTLSRVNALQIRDEGNVQQGGHTLLVDGIQILGAAPGSGASPAASKASGRNGGAEGKIEFVKPAASAPASRFLIGDFDNGSLPFYPMGSAFCAIDNGAGKDSQSSLRVSIEKDGGVQFPAKGIEKWLAAGCDQLSFSFRGDGAPGSFYVMLTGPGEWAWHGPAFSKEAQVAPGDASWKTVKAKFSDFRPAWKDGGGSLDLSKVANIQFRSGSKTSFWLDDVIVEPSASDLAKMPLVKPEKTPEPAPKIVAEWQRQDGRAMPLNVRDDGGRKLAVLNGVWEIKLLAGHQELDCTKPVSVPKDLTPMYRIKVPSAWDNFHEYPYPMNWADYHQAWYRRSFTIPDGFNGKRIHLRFSAVALHAQVFLNKKRIGEHWGSWTPFELDASDAANIGGENELLVFVADLKAAIKGNYDSLAISSWGWLDFQKIHGCATTWTLGETPKRRGIWQDVFLVGLDPVQVADAFVVTSVRDRSIEARVELKNEGRKPVEAELNCSVAPAIPAPERAVWSYEATKPGQEQALKFEPLKASLAPGESKLVSVRAKWDSPRLWEPDDPQLYYLNAEVKAGNSQDVKSTRFGFREVWKEGSNLILNGKPVHLLGLTAKAANHLSADHNRRHWEAVIDAYKKEFNISGVRLMSEVPYPVIPSVCDEKGMMLIEQSSNWASPGYHHTNLRAGEEFLKNLDSEYGEWICRDRNHPSILIWCPQNEGSADEKFRPMLRRMREAILKRDATRPIEYDGLGKCAGLSDLCAVHYCWNEGGMEWSKAKDMPFACVEQLNKILNLGDAVYNKDPGHPGAAYSEILFSLSWQRMKGFYATLIFSFTNGVHGLRPIFKNEEYPLEWSSDVELYPKPDHSSSWCSVNNINFWDPKRPKLKYDAIFHDALRTAYSPLFAGMADEVHDYASGQEFKSSATVINDTRQAQDVVLKIALETADGAKELSSHKLQLAAGEIRDVPIAFRIPDLKECQVAQLRFEILKDAQSVFKNSTPLDLYPADIMAAPKCEAPLYVFDPSGETAKLLKDAGLSFTLLDKCAGLKAPGGLIIGKDAPVDRVNANGREIASFVQEGGRVLVMERSEGLMKWLPLRVPPYFCPSSKSDPDLYLVQRPGGKEMATTDAPMHPIFKGLPDTRLYHWPAGEDGYLARGGYLRPLQYSALGNLRSLASTSAEIRYDDAKVGLLMELQWGKGLVLLSQFELCANYGRSPVATGILNNAIRYVAEKARPAPARALVVGEDAGSVAKERGFEGDVQKALPANLSAYDVVLMGPQSCESLAESGATLKAFAQNGGTVFLSLPEKSIDLAFIKTGMATVEDKQLFEKIKKSWNDKDWWGSPRPPVLIAKRGVALQGLTSRDLIPGKGETKTAFEIAGLADDEKGLSPALWAEMPCGKGRFIVSSLPFLCGDSYRAKLCYHTALTNLGVPFRLAEPKAELVESKGAASYKVVRAGQISVDGDLSEWTFHKGEQGIMMDWRSANPLVITCRDLCDDQVRSTSGNKDKSAVAFLMWDDSYLYLAAKVIDDRLYDKGGSYNGDAIELCLGKSKFTIDVDGNSFNIVGGENEGVKIPKEKIKYALKKEASLGGSRGTELIAAKGGDSVNGAPGYVVEMALPLDYLPMVFPVKQGTRFRLGIALDDNDGKDRKSQIAWPEKWKYDNPSTWGVAELSGSEN